MILLYQATDQAWLKKKIVQAIGATATEQAKVFLVSLLDNNTELYPELLWSLRGKTHPRIASRLTSYLNDMDQDRHGKMRNDDIKLVLEILTENDRRAVEAFLLQHLPTIESSEQWFWNNVVERLGFREIQAVAMEERKRIAQLIVRKSGCAYSEDAIPNSALVQAIRLNRQGIDFQVVVAMYKDSVVTIKPA